MCVCVRVSLCVGHTGKLRKTDEPIKMSFEDLTHVGPAIHVLDGGSRSEEFIRSCDG